MVQQGLRYRCEGGHEVSRAQRRFRCQRTSTTVNAGRTASAPVAGAAPTATAPAGAPARRDRAGGIGRARTGARLFHETMIAVRYLVLLLTVTMTGPPVASLLCDWACAAKHQAAPASAGACHEHGSNASMPTWQRGHQCHEVSTPPESVPGSTHSALGVLPVAEGLLAIGSAPQRGVHLEFHLHGPPHAPPLLLVSIRV